MSTAAGDERTGAIHEGSDDSWPTVFCVYKAPLGCLQNPYFHRFDRDVFRTLSKNLLVGVVYGFYSGRFFRLKL